MTRNPSIPIARLVEVLDRDVQRLTVDAAQAETALRRLRGHVDRLHAMSAGVRVDTVAMLAHRANAAGFRDQLIDMAAQCRDELGVHEVQAQAARAALVHAARRHEGMSALHAQSLARAARAAARTDQKRTDEAAGQAWQRRHAAARGPAARRAGA